MPENRVFDLGDILSITTERLVSKRHIDGVYDILNYMTHDNLFTHQLPRASEECAPILLKQHPQLADISVPDKFEDEDHVWRWLEEQKGIYGETLAVEPLNAGKHEHIDALEELSDMVGPEKVIVFNGEDPGRSLEEVTDLLQQKTATQAVTTTYVAYMTPGSFVPESTSRQVKDRNSERDLQDAPEAAFAFFYYDIITTVVNAGGERVETTSGRRNISGRYYIDAEQMDLDAVKALPGDHSILIGNMEANGWDPVLRCRTGNYQPLQEGDTLLTTS